MAGGHGVGDGPASHLVEEGVALGDDLGVGVGGDAVCGAGELIGSRTMTSGWIRAATQVSGATSAKLDSCAPVGPHALHTAFRRPEPLLAPESAGGHAHAMSIVTFEEFGPVAVITLNRPEARNAINPAMANAIGEAIDRLEGDPNLRVGILAATVTEPRPVFCAGDDLKAMKGEPAITPRGGFAGIISYQRTKPIIAAVDGLATSGGCEIVLACDMVVASTRASFAVAEIKWGLGALAGGLIRLPRLLGRAPAMDMVLTGEPISAERAYHLGLVSTLTDGDVVEVARGRAEAIAAFNPEVIRINLQTAHEAATINEDQLWEMNYRAADVLMHSPDMDEGLAKFEGRKGD